VVGNKQQKIAVQYEGKLGILFLTTFQIKSCLNRKKFGVWLFNCTRQPGRVWIGFILHRVGVVAKQEKDGARIARLKPRRSQKMYVAAVVK